MRLSVERAAPERAAGVAPAAARPTLNLAAWWALTLAVALGSAGAPAAAQESIASGIDAVFADLAVAGSPGCSVAVLKDGRTIHARGYGLASLEHDVPIRPDTVFDIASISKQFTAASIVLLDLEHRLSLDDSIAKHVPELAATGRGVTLRQMLHHTGGLRDYLSLLDLAGLEERGVSTPADALEILVRQEGVNFPPGTDYEYCNSGYFLMSEVVRRVTGKSLAVFAQERIFEPLGMRNTRFLEDQTLPVPRRATAVIARRKRRATAGSSTSRVGASPFGSSVRPSGPHGPLSTLGSGRRPSSVTTPTTESGQRSRSQIDRNSLMRPAATASTKRSCASLHQISRGVMPGSSLGAARRSIFAPRPAA